MELVFVIDSSESVGPENYEIIKDFVNALVDRVTVGRNATRIGLVLYSLEVKLVFNLARYATKQDIKQAIRSIPYMGEGTYTGTAIRKATQEAFYGSRLGVSKVAIVITDGQTDKREPVKLDMAVREAHAANIEMFALGIVNTSDLTQAEFMRELNLIASDPDDEHMFLIDDFNTLPGLRHLCLWVSFIVPHCYRAYIDICKYLRSDSAIPDRYAKCPINPHMRISVKNPKSVRLY